jgi:hypothetical protein
MVSLRCSPTRPTNRSDTCTLGISIYHQWLVHVLLLSSPHYPPNNQQPMLANSDARVWTHACETRTRPLRLPLRRRALYRRPTPASVAKVDVVLPVVLAASGQQKRARRQRRWPPVRLFRRTMGEGRCCRRDDLHGGLPVPRPRLPVHAERPQGLVLPALALATTPLRPP